MGNKLYAIGLIILGSISYYLFTGAGANAILLMILLLVFELRYRQPKIDYGFINKTEDPKIY